MLTSQSISTGRRISFGESHRRPQRRVRSGSGAAVGRRARDGVARRARALRAPAPRARRQGLQRRAPPARRLLVILHLPAVLLPVSVTADTPTVSTLQTPRCGRHSSYVIGQSLGEN